MLSRPLAVRVPRGHSRPNVGVRDRATWAAGLDYPRVDVLVDRVVASGALVRCLIAFRGIEVLMTIHVPDRPNDQRGAPSPVNMVCARQGGGQEGHLMEELSHDWCHGIGLVQGGDETPASWGEMSPSS